MHVNDETSSSWAARLDWALDLIDESPVVRMRAHEHLDTAARKRSEALATFNQVWMVDEQWSWTPSVTEAHGRYVEARRHVMPDALWDNVSIDDLSAWSGLPYVLLYLEWEVRFPGEWMAHGKGWGTKQSQLRHLTRAATSLPEWAQCKLIDLLGLVVQREHRVGDDEYARLARALPADLVRAKLGPLADSTECITRSRTGYLLWLLGNPQLPHPKPSQWRTWLAASIALPQCDLCGGEAKPILYGLPVPEARQAAEEGRLVLAGCFKPDDAPHWKCPDDHRWASEEQLWLAAIDIAIDTSTRLCSRTTSATQALLATRGIEPSTDQIAEPL